MFIMYYVLYKMLYFSVIIVVLIILILFLYKTDNYIIYNYLPYRNIRNIDASNKILVGIITIDRDIKKAPKMYNHLMDSINIFLQNNNTEIDIVVVTRESDLKSIDFWKKRDVKIITIPHYNIIKRHNMNKVVEKYNIIVDMVMNNKYDRLIIVESDVYINKDTISSLIQNTERNHIAVTYANTKWAGYPIIIVAGLLTPNIKNAHNFSKKDKIIGSWIGAVGIRREVFEDYRFHNGIFNNIEGPDVGLFQHAFKKRYSVILLDEVIHDFS